MNFAHQTNKIFSILEIEDQDAPINDEKREKIKDLITKVYYLGVSAGANKAIDDCFASLKKVKEHMTYSTLPAEMRIKSFDIYFDQAFIDKLKSRVELAREYLKTLKP